MELTTLQDEVEMSSVDAKDRHKMKNDENREISDIDTLCGIGKFHPRCVQCFATIKIVLLVLSLSVLAFSMDLSVSMITVTNLQKRYGLSSKFIGLYHTLKDVAEIISTILVAYFGGRSGCHKPRWIACGLVVCSLAYFTEALTQFISEPYDYHSVQIGNDTSVSELCDSENEVAYTFETQEHSSCGDNIASALIPTGSEPIILYLIAGIMVGLGNTPLLVLGITYIDDNVSKKSSPVYLGVIFAVLGIGPLVGMPLAGLFTNLYVDFYRVDQETIDIDPGDPRWVGAWWIGHLFTSILMMLMAILMFLVPKRMPIKAGEDDTKDCHDDNVIHVHATQEIVKRLKDFPKAVLRLITNLPLMMMILARAFNMANMGVAIFFAKYIEENYRVTSAASGLVLGGAVIFPACLGFLIGGVILRRWKPSLIKMAAFIVIVLGAMLAMPVVFMHLGCSTERFAGVTVPHVESSNITTYTQNKDGRFISTCNSNCACTGNYEPVCGVDDVTYYSSCYAGCSASSDAKNFTQCACITEDSTIWLNTTVEGGAYSGICGQSCTGHLILFAVFSCIVSMTSSIAMSSELILTLRCVSPSDKPFAIGLRSILTTLIGTLPSPIYTGALIDSACILWGTASCDEKGACLLYDLPDYRRKLFGLLAFLKVLSLLFFIIVWISLRRNPNPGKIRKPATLNGKQHDDVIDEVSNDTGSKDGVNESSQLMSGEDTENTTEA
ncbi:solute carrier organic anion transporter family member 2A1-like [Glandiceps talaboti]